MRRAGRLHNYPITQLRNRSSGYILITLMLFFTLLAISALAVLPQITQQIKRDREEEMIHRGVQYTRAVQRYYKKFGRYPTRIEELESSNNLRFLRKRYKDPITGKDFKLIRYGDPILTQLGFGQGFGQAVLPGGQAGLQPRVQGAPQPPAGGIRNQPQALTPTQGGTVVREASSPQTESSTSATEGDTDQSSSSSSSSSFGGGQVFGGGPILGAISASKDQSIREFNGKNHYKDWPFVYDPTSDRGGLLNTPTQPNLNQGMNPAAPGMQGQPLQGPAPQGNQPTGISNPQDTMPPDQ